jgi:hypothetical protein
MREIISVILLTTLSLYSVSFTPPHIATQEVLADTQTNEIPPLAIQVPIEEKEKVVADVVSEEKKTDNYTLRVGLGGARKQIKTITGDTIDERAKQFLDTA